MANEDTNAKKRKFPWKNSYTSMTQQGVEKRIGIRMDDLASAVVPIEEMLAQAGYSLNGEDPDSMKATKDEVYKQILRYLKIEGYPMDSTADFKEGSVNDLVLLIISPIIEEFIDTTGRYKVRLLREKQIVSEDEQTSGYEEFVVVDRISVTEEKYVFIIEAKRVSLGAAMKCLLSMKDMGDSNHGGVVYGFVTTGESWRMLRYDGTLFQKFDVIFETMRNNKVRWMRDCSVVVDCVYAALSNGGIVPKDGIV